MIERADDLQQEALRAFTLLCALRPNWDGALIVVGGLDLSGQALSIAANIAGAGLLAIESRSALSKAALRSGACDFVVNIVDEALRILKNEIRQRKPVSVALELDEASALEELLDRGVCPEMFTAFGEQDRAAAEQRFQAFGSTIVRSHGAPGAGVDADKSLAEFVSRSGLSSVSLSCQTGEALRETDAKLLQLIPPGDPRHRWLASAPRFFYRERPHRRLTYLTQTEREKLGI